MRNEILTTNTTNYKLDKFTYTSCDEASDVFDSFSDTQKGQMATVYQNAFGGEPWYEKFACLSCGAYAAGSSCPTCWKEDLPEAYPMDALVNETFPEMLDRFTPGVLLIAYDTEENVSGFSTGGFISLEGLVDFKYKGDERTLFSLEKKGGIDRKADVFYDNETCIDPSRQKSGLGRLFSQERLQTAVSMDTETVCGRTINLPWLRLKERQLTASSYTVSSFTPEGDTYAMNGVQRRFYVAKKGGK
ncbi:MAG: hypothetical protein H0W89_06805 [Candidatus Levybacteria bacterium]|nr:hypothetical protein [Candidatus Levybacteria bacterium]